MRAVILAGGKGTRLYPYTAVLPKPLMPIGDVPIIEIVIRQLIRNGITDITLALGHLAGLMKAYLAQREWLTQDITLSFVEEDIPTGTAGSLANIPGLSSTFLVMNGDLLTDLDYRALISFHREQKAQLTIATCVRHERVELGVLEVNDQYRVTQYIEKPVHDYRISMGVYVYEPPVLDLIRPGAYLDFPALVVRLMEKGEKVCAFPWKGQWLDIGRPDDFAAAQALFAEQPQRFDFSLPLPAAIE